MMQKGSESNGQESQLTGAGKLAEEMWDQRFAELQCSDLPDPKLVELVEPLNPGRALDLGCGPGRNAIWLAHKGWQVTGVDASSVGLAQAQDRATLAGVELETVQFDVLSYRPKSKVDLIVIANIHLAEPERTEFFLSAAEMLATDGHLYVAGHHLDDLGRTGPPDPERLYTVERLQDCFPDLKVLVLDKFQREIGNGLPPEHDVVVWAQK